MINFPSLDIVFISFQFTPDAPRSSAIRTPAYLSVAQLQVVQALRVRLLADVGLVHDEVLASSLLRQQHARVASSQLWGSRERVMHTAPSRRG